MYNTLISNKALHQLKPEQVVILDCRFQLDDPCYGYRTYTENHIPRAYYLHLDEDLSSKSNGTNGRHPLPDRVHFANKLAKCGVTASTQVVTYDDGSGPFAARAWWLLRWLGHRAVAVLDGGWQGWLQADYPTTQTIPASHTSPVTAEEAPALVNSVTASDILAHLGDDTYCLVDARSPERYQGQGDPLDPTSGHIPGALNRFFMENLNGQGQFKSAEVLKHEWLTLLGERHHWHNIVHQCGSGVSACLNILSMEYAGLTGSVLYPGSWSEWSAHPDWPVEKQN